MGGRQKDPCASLANLFLRFFYSGSLIEQATDEHGCTLIGIGRSGYGDCFCCHVFGGGFLEKGYEEARLWAFALRGLNVKAYATFGSRGPGRISPAGLPGQSDLPAKVRETVSGCPFE